MNKGFTSIEQSKHLLELGLDPQTADMYYEYTAEEPKYKIYVGKSISIAKNLYSYRNGHVIPAWSLSALLELMPKFDDNGRYYIGLEYSKEPDKTGYVELLFNFSWREDSLKTVDADNLLDASFEMVCWLLENGYIEKK